MSYLLDTNVFSELVCSEPAKQILKWFEIIPDESLYLSAFNVGEIRKGVEGLKIINPWKSI